MLNQTQMILTEEHYLPGVVYKGGSTYSLCYLLAPFQHQVGNGNGLFKHPAYQTWVVPEINEVDRANKPLVLHLSTQHGKGALR